MRLNMHRETPADQKISEKVEGVLLIFAWGLLSVPFVVFFMFFLHEGEIGIGLLLAAVGALISLCGAHLYMNEKHSYVEIDGDEIRAVEFIWCRPHENRFEASQIGKIDYCRIWYMQSSLPYIRVSDRQGQELLKVYRCPESERVFGELADRAKE